MYAKAKYIRKYIIPHDWNAVDVRRTKIGKKENSFCGIINYQI